MSIYILFGNLFDQITTIGTYDNFDLAISKLKEKSDKYYLEEFKNNSEEYLGKYYYGKPIGTNEIKLLKEDKNGVITPLNINFC